MFWSVNLSIPFTTIYVLYVLHHIYKSQQIYQLLDTGFHKPFNVFIKGLIKNVFSNYIILFNPLVPGVY